MKISIYKDAFQTEGHDITVKQALDRIKSGKSKLAVLSVRNQKSKEEADEIKKTLPSVTFSGLFGNSRTDDLLKKHPGLICLDFDKIADAPKRKEELSRNKYCYACWISPSGNGVKMLVKIADPSKHREHFDALVEEFKGVDKSGRNPSRLCFESYDPELFVNESSEVFTTIIRHEYSSKIDALGNDVEIFNNLLTWVAKSGKAFRTGERNTFVFVVASACCRFGLSETTAQTLLGGYALSDSSFSQKECQRTVRSAYKVNNNSFGSASFENERFIDKQTKQEVKIEVTEKDILELNRDNVIYGAQVKDGALDLYKQGYKKVKGIEVPDIDTHYKRLKGELVGISGIGNMGKSSFWRWFMLMRTILYGEKWAIYGPEDNPPEYFYNDLVEMYLGEDITPNNVHRRTSEQRYLEVYDWVTRHFFYVYPESVSPTPEVIKETFLMLIITENVDGVVIDPFNQMTNDYASKNGRTDKYLETILSDFARFARTNNVYFDIILHPTKLRKETDGNYPCPDVFDLADGAMWNNKLDDILIYHRPFATNPPNQGDENLCEFHAKKIRRQKIVGSRGYSQFVLDRKIRRFLFNGGYDPMGEVVRRVESDKQQEIVFENKLPTALRPNADFLNPYTESSHDYTPPYEDCPF